MQWILHFKNGFGVEFYVIWNSSKPLKITGTLRSFGVLDPFPLFSPYTKICKFFVSNLNSTKLHITFSKKQNPSAASSGSIIPGSEHCCWPNLSGIKKNDLRKSQIHQINKRVLSLWSKFPTLQASFDDEIVDVGWIIVNLIVD